MLSPIISRLAGPVGQCRFTPSCSQYAIEAVQTHGAFKGLALAAWRLLRCGPWGRCGHDPVPSRQTQLELGEFSHSHSHLSATLFPSAREAQKSAARR